MSHPLRLAALTAAALLVGCSSPATDSAAAAAPTEAAAPAPAAPVEVAAPVATPDAAPVVDAPQPIAAPAAAAAGSLSVYKSLGRRQCEAGGETPESLAAQLRDAGVEATPAGCADDGMMYAAMCGGGTGHLGVLEIRAADAERAAQAGFRPLKDLPDAQRIPCPAPAKDMMK